ncbi:hypothetical protein LWI28_002770 [Acer negundo]|uniref:F-box domain-containing protein n=1 Tax=Acer negundo TaxID=4023 RepID=A0AAD5IBS2_ACENE|nr:hypothetical protein LWI28_002770 [Acer negundo]
MMDIFSKLPDFIMHHIMSYLPVKQVARTSSLSKRWKGLSESFPIFNFRESYIHFMGKNLAFMNLDPTSAFDREQIERFHKLVPKCINLVDASLSHFSDLNLRMKKFRLMICVVVDVQLMSPVLEHWIRSAFECGVEELDLDFLAKKDT